MQFQRACRQCVHESARLPRAICSPRGSMKLRGAVKLPILPLPLCRTHSPRTARATNSCTPHGGLQGGRRESSLLTFAALFVSEKRDKHKEFLSLFYKRHLIRHASRDTFSRRRRLAKIPAFVSADAGFTPALHFQRACRQCVHESARLFRVICSHAWYR